VGCHTVGASASLQGGLEGLVGVEVSHDGHEATIVLTGPDGVWFGVGFNAKAMSDAPYAIIVDGSGKPTERALVEHGPGSQLAASVSVQSNSVVKGVRTITLTRPVAGASKQHYSIPTAPGDVNLITAVGNTPQLAYHQSRTSAKLTLLPTEGSACVCPPTTTTSLTYMNQSTATYNVACLDEPRSDMLKHGDGTGRAVPNAACNMQTYHGGLHCCAHHMFLTDLDQDHLIPNETDTYYLKWRYYFQEYEPPQPPRDDDAAASTAAAAAASHKHLHHWVFLIDASVNDYEEDNAHYGEASVGKITAHITGATIGLEDTPKTYSTITPLVMTPHCHAPSCIREELWNADTNEIICNVTALYGDEKYGALSEVFNEANYVAIPPCIFGAQEGLQTPFALRADTNITAIKYFNNTYRHLGQMAQWTGLMVYDTDPY